MLGVQLLEFILQLVEIDHLNLWITVIVGIVFEILQSILVQVRSAVDVFPENQYHDLHAKEADEKYG